MRKSLYHVYHRRELDREMLFGHLPEQAAASDYEKVADVRAEDLEEVFELTNHIDDAPWWQHPQVSPAKAQPTYRSTSVGDVVERRGKVWMVAGVGFVQVTWAREGDSAAARLWRRLTGVLQPHV